MPSAGARRLLASEIAQYSSQVGEISNYLTERGLSSATIARFQLGYTARDGPYPGRLAIPYLTRAGAWHIKYRCVQDHNCKDNHHPKYIYEHGITPHLFNAQTLLTAELVIVCEGELDAVAIEGIGVPAVGYPGADTWSKNKHWPLCFDDIQDVIVVADGDEPGVKAARSVSDSLKAHSNANVRLVELPPGEDSNSLIVKWGEFDFLDYLNLN